MMLAIRLHEVSQRTTLTLDDDVADRLRMEARRSGKSFKQMVNETIRDGLELAATRVGLTEPFEVHAKSMGLRPGLDLDNVADLLDQVEGSRHR